MLDYIVNIVKPASCYETLWAHLKGLHIYCKNFIQFIKTMLTEGETTHWGYVGKLFLEGGF